MQSQRAFNGAGQRAHCCHIMSSALLRGVGLAFSSATRLCSPQPPAQLTHACRPLGRHRRRALSTCRAAQSVADAAPRIALYSDEVELYTRIFGDREFEKEVRQPGGVSPAMRSRSVQPQKRCSGAATACTVMMVQVQDSVSWHRLSSWWKLTHSRRAGSLKVRWSLGAASP